jgi:hypothetical protein
MVNRKTTPTSEVRKREMGDVGRRAFLMMSGKEQGTRQHASRANCLRKGISAWIVPGLLPQQKQKARITLTYSRREMQMEFRLTDGIAILERTPATLVTLLEGLPDPWITGDEGPETWSPLIIVGHLVHCERNDWLQRVQVILAQDARRSFPPVDREAQLREGEGKPTELLLEDFVQLRKANIDKLRSWNLTEEDLALTGQHSVFGQVSLRQLLSTWVAHDLAHISQIARVMAKQYREAVGPWREYLSVMDR